MCWSPFTEASVMWTYHGAGEHPTKSHEGAIADDFRIYFGSPQTEQKNALHRTVEIYTV